MITLAEGLSQLYGSLYTGVKAIRTRCIIDASMRGVYVVLAKGVPVVYVYTAGTSLMVPSSVTATSFGWIYSNKLDTVAWEIVPFMFNTPNLVRNALRKDGLL